MKIEDKRVKTERPIAGLTLLTLFEVNGVIYAKGGGNTAYRYCNGTWDKVSFVPHSKGTVINAKIVIED